MSVHGQDQIPRDADRQLKIIELGITHQQIQALSKKEAQAKADFEAAVRSGDIKKLNAANKQETYYKGQRNWYESRVKTINDEAKRSGIALPKQISQPSAAEKKAYLEWLKEEATKLPGSKSRQDQVERLQKSLQKSKGDKPQSDPVIEVNPSELTHSERPGKNPLSKFKPRDIRNAKTSANLDQLRKLLRREIEATKGDDETAHQLLQSGWDHARTFRDQELNDQLLELSRRLAVFQQTGATQKELDDYNAEAQKLCEKLNQPFLKGIQVKLKE
ncbi:hypothetical protein [Gimesia panareensis]|uniref:hypothetical protein n=1 Tax=Gimesia panareensis TaxID=2527978 RepID=UPI0011A871C5|nr:hypothetical protein [Gimesia panareensis]